MPHFNSLLSSQQDAGPGTVEAYTPEQQPIDPTKSSISWVTTPPTTVVLSLLGEERWSENTKQWGLTVFPTVLVKS